MSGIQDQIESLRKKIQSYQALRDDLGDLADQKIAALEEELLALLESQQTLSEQNSSTSDSKLVTHLSGTLTFLFTDIEGSTQLWEQYPEAMKTALARHDAILRRAIETHRGQIFKTVGDAFYAVFAIANDALNAALAAQQEIYIENWRETIIRVRMGLHTGTVETRDGDYFGPPLNRVARLMSAGHGGQVLLSTAAAERVRSNLPADADLRDMGERRLKDLTRPEHIYQLLAPGLPFDFPPLKTLDTFQTNLPAQVTSFVGREKEILAIKALLAKNRLTTLTGSGGAGKTRLSLQVAADLLDSFPGGVWFVELAPLSGGTVVPQAVMSALSIRDEGNRPPLEILEDYLHARTSLLILDNCEHVIGATAQLAESLLQSCAGLRILASGRETLGIAGEVAYYVPSLSLPDPRKLTGVESLRESEAARLFIERARAALPTFTINEENVHAVAQICSRLDGIPLALELAAARVKVLKVEQIAERLDDRFHLLTGGSRTALPRHQTLRALIDWSHDLLPEPERVLLRRLSVFSGGWTLEAAEAVCSDQFYPTGTMSVNSSPSLPTEHCLLNTEILDLLMQLVNKSLVIMDANEATEARYHLLETVRRYAYEKLTETGQGISIRDRHLEYFLSLAERAEPELVKSHSVEWIPRLEIELDNIHAALKWSITSKNPELGLRLTNAMLWFWDEGGYTRDGYEWLTQLLNQPGVQLQTRARALGVMGVILAFGDFGVNVCPILEESLAIHRELGDQPGIAQALLYEGIFVFREQDVKRGVDLVLESLAMYRALNHKLGIFLALDYLGRIIYEHDYLQAHVYLTEALEICYEIDYPSGITRSLANLGHLAVRHEDYSAAHVWLEKALTRQRQFGKGRYAIHTLAYLGELANREGNYAQSQAYYKECLTLLDQTGGLSTMAGWILVKVGHMTILQGELANTKDFFEQSMQHFTKTNEKIGIVFTIEGLASLALLQERTQQAVCLMGWADMLREAINNPRPAAEQADMDSRLAKVRTQLGEAAFAAAQSAGREMSMDEAIAYSLKQEA